MKKTLVCTLLAMTLACGGTALYAQQDNMTQGAPAARAGMPMSPEQHLQHLTKMLNLTADQQEKIKPILESESQQMQTLHQDTTISQQDKWSKMRQLRQSTRDQIKPILTADQQQKWEQMRDPHMQHGPGPTGAGQGQPQQTPPQQ